MRCLDDCHTYELDTFMGRTVGPEMKKGFIEDLQWQSTLHFYEECLDGTKIDGVTNEEVLKVLIHRLKFLNEEWQGGKFDCVQNRNAIRALKEALFWLERRAADRIARKVEGSHEP